MTRPCLILAAGFGTRMGALTADRPKPLIEVAGRCLLDRALDVARDAGCAPIAVNAHYRADQIAAHLAGADDVTLLIETPAVLDSGGAVKNARDVLGAGPILTLNSDNAWAGPNPLAALAAAFDPTRMGALLLLAPRDRAVGREGPGDFRMDPDGRLTLDKRDDSYVYLGAQMLDPTICYAREEAVFSLLDSWRSLQGEGRLFGLVHEGDWADIGHPAGIAQAEAMLETADV